MKPSRNCLNLVMRSEGFRASPYLCPAGKPTIGYGSTFYQNGTPVTMQDAPISAITAAAILQDTLAKFGEQVDALVHVPVNQNQFDALTDFAYNAGTGNLKNSTLLRKLNAKDYAGAASEFGKWIYGGGKVLEGLVVRRRAERQLFLKEVA